MSETFGLEIYASNKLAYAGRAQKLIIPAVDGERGFLAHHANVVEAIIPGEMAVKILNGESDISTMPIEYTDVTKKYNKAICDDLGLTVPEGYEEIEA